MKALWKLHAVWTNEIILCIHAISWFGFSLWHRLQLKFCSKCILNSRELSFPHGSAGKESACNAWDPSSIPESGKVRWRRDRLPTLVFLGFPCSSAGKESVCNAGDLGSIPGLGRSPGEGKSYPFQYSGLEDSMDCVVHGVANSRGWVSNFHFHHFPGAHSPVDS